jgi:hypothetical protein
VISCSAKILAACADLDWWDTRVSKKTWIAVENHDGGASMMAFKRSFEAAFEQ